MKGFTKTTFLRLATALVLFVGCSSKEQRELEKGLSAIETKNFPAAIEIFERIVKVNSNEDTALKAAKEGSKAALFETKDYNKALFFYRHIVLYSKDPDERLNAQKQIAYIFFDNLADYTGAITEFYKLFAMPHRSADDFNYRMVVARAYYYLSKHEQANSEIEEMLRLPLQMPQKFELLLLRANVYISIRRFDLAIKIYQQTLEEFPDLAAKENVVLNLALCYEEEKNFAQAIDALEKLKQKSPTPEYFEFRIKRLKERLKNQPGARGFKK